VARTAAAIEQFAQSLLPAQFVSSVPATEGGLSKFLKNTAANQAKKAHVILLTGAAHAPAAYKKLSAAFERFLHFGVIATNGNAKTMSSARKLLGLPPAAQGKSPSVLRVVWTDASGTEVSHEDYTGPMKLAQLDAWLYRQAKKVKAAGGGIA